MALRVVQWTTGNVGRRALLARFLAAGVNVVTTAAFVTGWGFGAEARARLEHADLPLVTAAHAVR